MSTEMTYHEYMSYASEIGTLEHLVSNLPDERAIERIGLQSRLNRIQDRLHGVKVPPFPKKLSVSFSGQLVSDNYGIDANFGAEAITMFSDTIRITFAGLTGALKATGQVPRSELSQPIITGVGSGSFGFEMEIPTPQAGADDFSHPEEAVKRVQQLLRLAREGSDDDLSSMSTTIHPRAVNKVAELLDFMRKKETRFTMDYQGDTVRFHTNEEIKNAAARLNPSNKEDRTDYFIGTMIGVIPTTRDFQLNPIGQDPILGKIGHEIQDPYETGQQYTNQHVIAGIRTVRIGRGIPRYTLFSVSEAPGTVGL